MDFVQPKPILISSRPCVCDSCGTWPLSPPKPRVDDADSTIVEAREEVGGGNTCSLPTPPLTSSLIGTVGQRTQFPIMDVQQSVAGSVVNVTHSGLSDHLVRVSRLKALARGQLEKKCKTEEEAKRWAALCPQCRGALAHHFDAQVRGGGVFLRDAPPCIGTGLRNASTSWSPAVPIWHIYMCECVCV